MNWKRGVVGVVLFAAGMGAGWLWARGKGIEPAVYQGKGAREAAAALLAVAETQAGKGSWERIGVGRVYYLSGDKARGQAVFDDVAKGAKDSDWWRIAKVYNEAGEWDKAEPILRRLSANSGDDSGLALAGALYNLHGDRATAEALFARCFKAKSDEVWDTLSVAGSYVGVRPD